MAIYMGRGSCYARREGIYVKDRPREGVNVDQEALAIIYLIMRDLRRGKTYDDRCRVIRMTRKLAKRRINYLIALAKKHGASGRELKEIRAIVDKYVGRVDKGKYSLTKEDERRAKKWVVEPRRKKRKRKRASRRRYA